MARGNQALARRKKIKRFRCEQKARLRRGKDPFISFRDLDEQDNRRDLAQRIRMAQAVKRCAVPGCEAKHHAKGYCAKHYKQMKRNGNVVRDRRTVTLVD